MLEGEKRNRVDLNNNSDIKVLAGENFCVGFKLDENTFCVIYRRSYS